ncbi:hypothetical protein PENSPDRAFT_656738 [Peniophora sp. CONT]|nr:hypothetical protein PENSPDRAFT_656738 [Peniophora sp. CONT]
MFREQNNTFCIFPECKEAGKDLASAQSRNRHVHAQHVGSLRVLCVLCDRTYARADALQVHQQSVDGCKTLTTQRRKLEKKGKGKMRKEPVVEDDGAIAEGPGFHKEGDDDDADIGGIGGMFAAGAYGTIQV